jgi:hypothetical protein
MPQTEPSAGLAAPEVPLTGPPRERRGARELVITVLVIAATFGIVVVLALVIVPSVSAGGGCGGG